MNKKQEKKLLQLRAGNRDEWFAGSKLRESITEQSLGSLSLPTGRIVAADPLCLYDTDPFEKRMMPGSYPVWLYIHHIDDDCRVAFAEIRFSEAAPVRFEMALTWRQTEEELADGEYFGYGVDSGVGSFMDTEACSALVRLTNIEDGIPPELDELLEESYIDTYSAGNFALPESDYNAAIFSTGFGDGCYPSFWGYDEEGEVCCLITDFMTVEDEAL